MKRILTFVIMAVMLVCVFTGCERKHSAEIQSIITSVEEKMEKIDVNFEPMKASGLIDADTYNMYETLKMKYNENVELFKTTQGKEDKKILEALKECDESANTILDTIDNQLTDIVEVKDKALEMKDNADRLAPFMSSGMEKGYIDAAVMNRYNAICNRLSEIFNDTFGGNGTIEELDGFKEELAVMSSQCGADKTVVDSFVEKESSQEAETEKTADNNAEKTDLNDLVENFTALQNEASQKVDKGEISQDDYMVLIEAGTKLAGIKEEVNKNGAGSKTDSDIADCKRDIYEIASKMGSSLAEKFK